MANKTPVQLPADVAKKYRLTRPIYGGPVFDFPQFGMLKINLSTITEAQADRLYRKGWAGIEPVPVQNTFVESAASPAAVPSGAKAGTPTVPKASKPDGEQ